MALSQAYIDALNALQDANGEVDPKALVDAARADVAHPMHAYFEWRNDVAGELYREQQARRLIHQYKVDIPTTRGVVNVSAYVVNPESKKYRNIKDSMPDEADIKAQMYERQLRDIRGRLKRFGALAAVFEKTEDFEQLMAIIDRMSTPSPGGGVTSANNKATTKTIQ